MNPHFEFKLTLELKDVFNYETRERLITVLIHGLLGTPDDTKSQFKISCKADALKTDVNMFQNMFLSVGKCKGGGLYFSKLEHPRRVGVRHNFKTPYNYSKLRNFSS